jgi:hypothetical protein
LSSQVVQVFVFDDVCPFNGVGDKIMVY